MAHEDDNWWFDSKITGLNLSDKNKAEESNVCGITLGGTARLSQKIKTGTSPDVSSASNVSLSVRPTVPLNQVFTEKSLAAVLEADAFDIPVVKFSGTKDEEIRVLRRQINNRWEAPEVSETVKSIILGQPFSLEMYKSLNQKKDLLKGALALGDGDAILEVVQFLSRTLKKSLFYQVLSSSPVAVNHYVNYLNTRMQITELTDILDMLGRSKDASMKHFTVACQSSQRQLQRLKACARNHFDGSKNKVVVENFVKLLEWQESVKVKELQGESVCQCLEWACTNHWGEPQANVTSPLHLSEAHGLSDKQYEWVATKSLAQLKAWKDVESLYAARGWLGGKRIKSSLPLTQVVVQLHKLGAPPNVLITYLQLIDDLDKRLTISKKLQCHKAVIDTLVSQRDRQSLLNYKTSLHPQSEDYFYAESSLRLPTVKWKN